MSGRLMVLGTKAGGGPGGVAVLAPELAALDRAGAVLKGVARFICGNEGSPVAPVAPAGLVTGAMDGSGGAALTAAALGVRPAGGKAAGVVAPAGMGERVADGNAVMGRAGTGLAIPPMGGDATGALAAVAGLAAGDRSGAVKAGTGFATVAGILVGRDGICAATLFVTPMLAIASSAVTMPNACRESGQLAVTGHVDVVMNPSLISRFRQKPAGSRTAILCALHIQKASFR